MPVQHKSRAQDAEWEVLPPERQDPRQQLEPLFRWIALLMDDLIRLPGTNFRIGIDPLIGLIPGIGDTGSAMVSAVALIKAARHGLPKIILARMAVNILLNELIGIIPIAGDAFSFWFKSNARNHRLIQEFTGGRRTAKRSDWVFVIGILIALGLIVSVGIFVSFFVLQQLIKLLSGH